MLNINNFSESAKNYPFLVVREVKGEFWFWDAYKDKDKAFQAAVAIDGIVVYNTEYHN